MNTIRQVRAHIRKGYADTPAGQIHFAEAGEGPALLLLGGSPRTHRSFLPLMPLLAPYVRALAVDIPGFGASHAAPTPVTVPKLAECIVHFMDSLGIAKAHVFGLHTGNKLGAALGSEWPGRVDRLILAGQSHSIVPELAHRNALLQPYYLKYKNNWPDDPAGAHRAREWLAVQQNLNAIWWPDAMLHSATVGAKEVGQVHARALDYLEGCHAAVAAYEAVMAYDLESAYRGIRAPTLVLEMQTEREAAIKGQGERVRALIPGAISRTLLEADGLALEHRPAEFARPILDFLCA